MGKFYSTFEAAKICHVSPGSLIRWIHEGKLNAAKTAGGHHRIHEEDLLRLLQFMNMPYPGEQGETAKNPVKILVVDDEPNIRSLIQFVLDHHVKSALVEFAKDGFEAGWKAFRLQPDLVILDLLMPGMDGFKVLEFLRGLPELRQTRVLVVTALHDPEVREKVLGLGANDILHKPFHIDELREKVLHELSTKGGERFHAA